MKVLFVNPEFPDTYWSFRHALPFERKRCAFPPLGLLTVSALLPKSWERRLVDLNVRPLKSSDISWADMVFVTGMLVQKESLHDVVRRAKAMGKRVVIGGPYITTTIEGLPEADHIFIGEAESTLPQFVKDLADGEDEENLPGCRPAPAFDDTGSRLSTRGHQALQLDVGAVFPRLSFQLRILRHHRNLRTCAAHKKQSTNACRT